MDIKELLAPAHALVDVRADDKTGLLEQLAERAATARNVAAERVSSELLKREQLGSTGVGGGVAIPHARLPELKRPFGVLARLRRAVDFESIDGQPVDLVFMLLLPTASAGEHLNALAAAARKLRDPGVLAQLRGASDGAALYQAMAGPSSN